MMFSENEMEYEDHLNKMEAELETKSTSELNLTEDNEALKVWEEKANRRAATEKKSVEKERALVEEGESLCQ